MPRSFFQISLPLMSKQYRPSEPKNATTCFPSVAGVGDAYELCGCRRTRGVAFVRHGLDQTSALVLQIANVGSIALGTVVRYVGYRRWVFPAQELLQAHGQLHPSEVRAQAEVRARPEREVAIRVAVDHHLIGLLELTRVIELYNTRNGTTRTGCYKVDATGEDGFAPDPARANAT